MGRMADVFADHKGIEDTIGLGNDLTASSAGTPGVDDDELKDGSGMLIEEQKKEEEAEKERVRLEEKRKAEGRSGREGKRTRKVKDEAETLRQEEEPEVQRKLEEEHVSPEIDPRKDWEKGYDEVRAEKAAEATRDDREVELRMKDLWRGRRGWRRSSGCLGISCFHLDGLVREIGNVWILSTCGGAALMWHRRMLVPLVLPRGRNCGNRYRLPVVSIIFSLWSPDSRVTTCPGNGSSLSGLLFPPFTFLGPTPELWVHRTESRRSCCSKVWPSEIQVRAELRTDQGERSERGCEDEDVSVGTATVPLPHTDYPVARIVRFDDDDGEGT